MIIGIDLGSNTLRVALMNNNFEIIKSYEIIVGSAKGLKKGDSLSDEAKNNILDGLTEIKKRFDFDKFNHIAVATEAFRMAKDSLEFFNFIKIKFNIKFEIISGQSEAKFVNLAVENRLKKLGIKYKNLLSIDLGGASTEISNGKFFKSFQFGIVTFFNEYNSLEKMYENVNSVVKDAKEFIENLSVDTIVLTSGVPTTLITIDFGINYNEYNADLINGKTLNYTDFDVFIDKILNMSKEEATLKVGKNRAIYVVGGIILLKELLSAFKRNFIVVDDGLREGVIISKIINKFNEIKEIK